MQPVRGFRDLIGQDFEKIKKISKISTKVAEAYNYQGILLPILEHTNIFSRTLGNESDIVNKEMFTFLDRNNESLTLRPEGTASAVRAFLSKNLTQSLPQKFYYEGPMFRYERPQKGRYRQFYHFGIECFGIDHPYIDTEVIAIAINILNQLDIQDFKLQINTIGNQEVRANYNKALKTYLVKYKNELSEDSQRRLETNPLRILDSKNNKDQEIIQDAPQFSKFLSVECIEHFEKVCTFLKDLHIPYEHNPRLVRGLDYYGHTAFEIKHNKLGAQDTIIAGGRYNNLVTEMGGPNISGIGCALGMDRIALLLNEVQNLKPVIIIPFEENCIPYALQINKTLIAHGIKADISYRQKLAKDLKHAEKVKARYAILIGDNEVKQNTVTLKFLAQNTPNITTNLDQIMQYLK